MGELERESGRMERSELFISMSSGLHVHICCVLQDVSYPSFVKIVEVGPRDGLQNEKVHDFVVFKFSIFVEYVPSVL